MIPIVLVFRNAKGKLKIYGHFFFSSCLGRWDSVCMCIMQANSKLFIYLSFINNDELKLTLVPSLSFCIWNMSFYRSSAVRLVKLFPIQNQWSNCELIKSGKKNSIFSSTNQKLIILIIQKQIDWMNEWNSIVNP